MDQLLFSPRRSRITNNVGESSINVHHLSPITPISTEGNAATAIAATTNHTKRKRPSPIRTTLSSDACAIPSSEQAAEASVSASLGATAQHSARSDPVPYVIDTANGNGNRSLSSDERVSKCRKHSSSPLHHSLPSASPTKDAPPSIDHPVTIAAIASPAASPSSYNPHTNTVLAAMSACTGASQLSFSRGSSASVSAVTSAESTPLSRSLLLSAGGLPSTSMLSTPSWSPLASSLAGSAAVSARATTAMPQLSFAFSEQTSTALSAIPTAVNVDQHIGTVPTTPPSNVASPSVSPRRLENDTADGEEEDPTNLTIGNGNITHHMKLTVNTSGSFRTSNHISPSSSAAHSPTSTASQLRAAHTSRPSNSAALLAACASPAVSIAPPSITPAPAYAYLGTPLIRSNSGGATVPLAVTLSPHCSQHSSPARSTSDSHTSLSPQRNLAPRISGGSAGSAGSGSSAGARSPCASPSSQAASWTKPFFLSRLHVNIPELSPLIPSPVPLGVIETPAAAGAPRPSMAQAAKDREREQRGILTPSAAAASIRLMLMSPQAGSILPAVTESSTSALLTAPVAHADGIASRGAHYAISLLKGRRRRMEDMFIQATIEVGTEQQHTTATNSKAAESVPAIAAFIAHEEDCVTDGDTHASHDPPDEDGEPCSPPANLFGIADGHGRAGALVAQLTAQLLPVILQRNIRKAHPPTDHSSAAATAVPSLSAGVPSLLSPPPRSTRTWSVTMSPLQLQFGSAAPVIAAASNPPTSAAALPPLHSGPIPSPLPSLLLSPAVVTVTPGRPPPSPVAIPSASPTSASPIVPVAPSPPTQAEIDATAALSLVLDESTCAADPIAVALQQSFLQVDAHILAGKHNGGTTCTTAYIHQPPLAGRDNTDSTDPASACLYIAHVGDSRAVLSSAGGQAIPLSSDHKPNRPDERIRVEAAGGHVVFYSGWRVDGSLNVSRALGDANLKDESSPLKGRVIALPEISRRVIDDSDEFIIVASDGVWGRLSNQQAIDIVRRELLSGGRKVSANGLEAEVEEAEVMPPHPSLTHEHSFIVPRSGSDTHIVAVSNPVQTPRTSIHPITERSSAGYGREDSTDTIVSNIGSGGAMSRDTSAPLLTPVVPPQLNTKGSLMSTTFSAATVLPSPAVVGTSRSSAHTPIHGGKPSLLSSAYSTLGVSSHAAPFASPRNVSDTAASGGTFGFREGFLLSPAQSSTKLTSPTGALTITHQDSVSSTTISAVQIQTKSSDGNDVAASADAILPPLISDASNLPCCWSSLRERPELITAASEALIQYAFEQGQSMDNLSACVVLLHPFQHTNKRIQSDASVQGHVHAHAQRPDQAS
jgi:serine/threonine protein phosphatase PrpC